MSTRRMAFRNARLIDPASGLDAKGGLIGMLLFGPRGRAVLLLNPVHGLIVNFRSAVFNQPFEPLALGSSLAVSLGLLLFGCLYFRRVERRFADII